uniref:Semaphorin 6C n=1 Tax=Pavo cristatus TaxID=9049 RepID=A0A8C9G9U2_PAVCR
MGPDGVTGSVGLWVVGGLTLSPHSALRCHLWGRPRRCRPALPPPPPSPSSSSWAPPRWRCPSRGTSSRAAPWGCQVSGDSVGRNGDAVGTWGHRVPPPAATAAYPRFGGLRGDNGSAELGIGFQRMLRLNGTLLVDGCHNHIRVLLPRDARTLFVCGTNAFSPVCRTYQALTLQQEGEELPGQARCPFDARQSIAATFADDRLYSATVADFQASDAVIYRSVRGPALRSIKYSSRWLREPHFVHAMPHGAHVYFFFREMAAELGLPGKVPVSRVGRVCRNDAGGSPRVLERRWTSFLKKRLQCAVPGDVPFHFDVLEAVTAPHTLHGRPAVLAVFGTQRNSIPGSAVCAFYLADVERAFEGPFADPRGAAAPWPPVPEERVPRPRPGCCAGMGSAAAIVTSGDIPDDTLSFAKEHPLLHGAVAPAGGRPLFTQTGTRLTQLAVDAGAGPRGNHTVLFVGSEDGRVLKVLTDLP